MIAQILLTVAILAAAGTASGWTLTVGHGRHRACRWSWL